MQIPAVGIGTQPHRCDNSERRAIGKKYSAGSGASLTVFSLPAVMTTAVNRSRAFLRSGVSVATTTVRNVNRVFRRSASSSAMSIAPNVRPSSSARLVTT